MDKDYIEWLDWKPGILRAIFELEDMLKEGLRNEARLVQYLLRSLSKAGYPSS